MSSESIRVAIRESNPTKKDIPEHRNNGWVLHENTIQPLSESVPKDGYPMEFDFVFNKDTSNREVFESLVAPIVASSIGGYNGTVFTYGPTSSGKWFTMEGDIQDAGIIPRTIDEVFKSATKKNKTGNYLIRCAYIMIHNNQVYDLLKYHGKEVIVTNLPNEQITVAAREAVVSTKYQAFDLFNLGMKNRTLYFQNCNLNIKQCDMIFRMIIEHEVKQANDIVVATAHLNLVTLSGSERVSRPANTRRFAERDYVNKYMSTFASIITKKINKEPVNYNDSILTMLCRNAIGGNAKTAFIACFLNASVENTHFTLNFADKMRKIQNMSTMNIIGINSVLREVTSQIHSIETDLEELKQNCELLSTVGVVMQALDFLRDRIKLLQLVFVKPEPIDGDDYDFSSLQSKIAQAEFSLLELRILNVFSANLTFSNEHIGKTFKLPFEMLYFTLSTEVGNEFISHMPEDYVEEPHVIDYLHEIDPECDLELPCSDDETVVTTTQDTMGDDMPDVTNITSEYSALERSITSQIQSEELRAEINNLSSLFHSTYNEQVAINKNVKKQNQELIQEVVELKRKYTTEETEKSVFVERLETVERELSLRNRPIQGDVRQQYELLLAEADRKDIEYFTLKRDKDELEKQVQQLTTTVKQCKLAKSPTPAHKKLATTESTVFLLQSELRNLNEKLAEQDFIMEEMSAKHKRRVEQLLKRVHEKESPYDWSLSSPVASTEKQVQATPSAEDTVAQTEKEFKLGFNVCLQTDPYSEPIVEVEDISAQTESENVDVALQTDPCIIVPPTPRSIMKPDLSVLTEESQEYDTAEINVDASFASLPSTSSSGTMTQETLSPEEEECLVDLKRCESVIEENMALLRNVNKLHVLYIKDIGKHVDRDSKLHEKMRKKEEELFQVKSELQSVNERLRNANDDLFKIKEKRASQRFCTKKSQTLKTVKVSDCASCSELTSTIEDLEKKLSDLEASEPTEKIRTRIALRKKEIDSLQEASQELNKKYLKLKEDYEVVLKMFESPSGEPKEEPDLTALDKESRCEIS